MCCKMSFLLVFELMQHKIAFLTKYILNETFHIILILGYSTFVYLFSQVAALYTLENIKRSTKLELAIKGNSGLVLHSFLLQCWFLIIRFFVIIDKMNFFHMTSVKKTMKGRQKHSALVLLYIFLNMVPFQFQYTCTSV